MLGPFGKYSSPPSWTALPSGELYRTSKFGYEYAEQCSGVPRLHRLKQPARYWHDKNGHHEEYWVHGKRHRDDGPAIVHSTDKASPPNTCQIENIGHYLNNPNILESEWWLGNEKYDSFSDWIEVVGLSEHEVALQLLKGGQS